MLNKSVLILCVLTLSLVGCTSLKKVTGQTNDTILPGAREDVLPPDQTTARDPSITGGQPAPGTGIQQQTLAQPGMGEPPLATQPGAPLPGHVGTVVTCDPLVETCPGMTPPPPTKPVSAGKAPAGKVIVPPKAKTAASTSAKAATTTAPQTGADATAPAVAGQAPAVETVGTDPMKPQAKPVKKKKKKLVLKPKTAAPAAPDANAPADATQAPPPLVPPDAQPQ
jgi:hypothetical protein